jgi:hypothetical protein
VIVGVLVELIGKLGAMLPKHNGPILAKVGIIEVVITISMVPMVAHCPASGVNVKVMIPAMAVLIVDGFHVPAIGDALFEFIGKLGADAFKQSGPIGVKVGVILGAVISISTVVADAHCPASGVKV